jgi:ribokinase
VCAIAFGWLGEAHIPAPQVRPVVTTGAGVAFYGVLAARVLERVPFEDAVRRAVVAAGLSVTRLGARDGMPARDAIDAAAS